MQTVVTSTVILTVLYSLQALSFVLILRSTGALNFAQGQVLALGAYGFYELEGAVHHSFFAAIVCIIGLEAALGLIIYFAIIKRLRGAPIWSTVIALFGVGIIIDSLLQLTIGVNPVFLPRPVKIRPISLPGHFLISTLDVWVVGLGAVVIVGLFALMWGTRLGLRMRACADNPLVATYGSINPARVAMLSWSLGCILAGLAGVAIAFRSTLDPTLSGQFLTAFPAVLLGGFDSLGGAVVGSLILAFVVQLGTTYVNTLIGLPLGYALILAMLIVRPTGLFGTRDVARL